MEHLQCGRYSKNMTCIHLLQLFYRETNTETLHFSAKIECNLKLRYSNAGMKGYIPAKKTQERKADRQTGEQYLGK